MNEEGSNEAVPFAGAHPCTVADSSVVPGFGVTAPFPGSGPNASSCTHVPSGVDCVAPIPGPAATVVRGTVGTVVEGAAVGRVVVGAGGGAAVVVVVGAVLFLAAAAMLVVALAGGVALPMASHDAKAYGPLARFVLRTRPSLVIAHTT